MNQEAMPAPAVPQFATASTEPFTLQPPTPVAPVPVESASGKVRLEAADLAELDANVAQFLDEMTALHVQDPKFRDIADRLHAMGSKDIEASASVSNRLLERPVRAMQSGLFDAGSDIGKCLVDLRNQVEALDPSRQGDLFAPRKLLGVIPFGNRVRDYFDRYQSSQAHLNAIVESLKRGKDELIRDNASVEQEKANLWSLMQRLEKYIYIGKRLDAGLEERATVLDTVDAEKSRVVREELLFYTRQKVTDLLTQLAVNVQGYLALDMVRKNNLELIKGVDRATTTTISALRTAVVVAQALTNQKLVLDQISALNTTTSGIIESTSSMLREQSSRIHEQAASATIDIAALQKAFENVYATMDALADFKVKALGSMRVTVDSLSAEVEKAKSYVDRVRRDELRAAHSPAGTVAL